jgi:hypothetical protein
MLRDSFTDQIDSVSLWLFGLLGFVLGALAGGCFVHFFGGAV